MTAMELQQRKASLIENYINKIDSMELSDKVEKALKRLMKKEKQPLPCVVHSKEEMIAAVLKSTEEIERGEYVTDEELSEEIRTWWK
ncbi:hypothetical protein [Parabacteroides sp.]